MSRRWFFRVLGGAAAAAAIAPRIPTGGLFDPKADIAGKWATGKLVNSGWSKLGLRPTFKIGDKFTINASYPLTEFTITEVVESGVYKVEPKAIPGFRILGVHMEKG